MMFKELTSVDKLMECVPLVNDIVGDVGLIESIKGKTYLEAAVPVYEAHTKTLDSLMEILEEKTGTAMGTMTAVAKILAELFKGGETTAFFITLCGNMKSAISAMVNTEEEQSTAS